MTEHICQFKDQPPQVLLNLEAFLEVHGQNVFWWGTADSPNTDCRAIRLDEYRWLVMTPYLKGDAEFIQVLPSDLVGPDD